MLTSELKGQRTLATVVFTDCVGFSARMSVNEEHTLDLIRRDLKLMKKVCERFEGRVLKTTGDGLLMCFSSAVKAVECAIEIQREIAEAITTLPPSDALLHRIGIHLADMYITETDVMGNGVNIAARLQTEADPGGICISQTVYDVAKHGLQLVTEYLGPRDLKNIREVVPAYKVLLDQEIFENDPYLEAAHHLEQSPNLSRIRKLMFYVCKHRWEADETKLMRLHLRGIVQEFLGMASSYEQLRGLLNSAVGNLSKQVEYSLVANEILSAVASFYMGDQPLPVGASAQPENPAIAPANSSSSTTPEQQQLYRQIAQKLDHHSDALRIKKLLYYICKRTWASNVAQLNGISTESLVQTIHGLAPDSEQLRQLIDKFVQTLNKRAEYSLVAVTLVGQVGALYGESLSEVSTAVPNAVTSRIAFTTPEVATSTPSHPPERANIYHAIAARLEQDPQILRIKKLLIFVCKSQWTSDPTQLASFSTAILVEELHTLAPTIEQLQQALSALVKSLSKQAEYHAIANLLIQKLRPLYQIASASRPATAQAYPPAPLPTANPSSQPNQDAAQTDPIDAGTESRLEADIDKLSHSDRQPINLFDVRLAIQKYTNPLRAKILAFSALHSEFHFSEQDWFNLKMYELDALLRGLLKACRSYTDLEHLLYSTARRLRDPEDLIQAADTVTKFLRIFYVHGSPSLLVSLPPDETKISLDDFEEATRGFANLDDEFDHTCQLVSPSSGLNTILNQPTDSGSSTCLLPSAEQDPVSGG
ncbi:MAG: adenylate/guanylate cyclase domain-containing protein [Oscillatoriales cyanobacterium C42_A2020_001]|nr:adenylate/guanylate cyclase domain-containing protein [Leptolyngbyaceae cyanobacterium C42_A2020_001]